MKMRYSFLGAAVVFGIGAFIGDYMHMNYWWFFLILAAFCVFGADDDHVNDETDKE